MSGDERRITYRLTSEWLGLKRQQPFPSIDFLDPNRFSVDWNQCVLIRLLGDEQNPGEESFEFEFIGAGFRKDAMALTVGTRLNAVPEECLLSLTSPALLKVFERQTAVIYSGCRSWRSSGAIYFQSIAVPFSDNRGVLKYGLGALGYKVSKDPLSPDDARTEYLEFCDGGWAPFGPMTTADLIAAA